MSGPTSQMTDAERLELAAKLDKELDDFIDGLEQKPYTEGWHEDRWREEMEKHPFFMKGAPGDGEELSPLMQGLQQLKYDPLENTPEELAVAYKDDGNFNFKHKNYRLAIIAYTEALKVKCGNSEIESSCYNNRSASNYYLKNYRSALIDCKLALKLKPDYYKVLLRAANCCFHTGQYESAIEFCNKLPDNKTALSLKTEVIKKKKEAERDSRRTRHLEKTRTREEQELFAEIRKRGIKLEGDGLRLEDLEPQVPQLASFPVHLNEDRRLVWPVIFLYPEHKVVDFIQKFAEDERFLEHLEQIFQEAPEWDRNRTYIPANLRVYFENRLTCKMYEIDVRKSLLEVLQMKHFVTKAGTPSFIVFVRDSPAEKFYLEKF